MTDEIKVLTLAERKKWKDLIKNSFYSDLHFLPEYLEPFEGHTNSKACMAMFENKKGKVLFPFFKRKIDVDSDELNYDLISPWYYGGPLFIGETSESQFNRFSESFERYCHENNIVSLFSRMHPYLSNHSAVDNGTMLDHIGTVVWIDLTMKTDMIWKRSFSSSCRKEIRRIRKKNFDIRVSSDRKDLSRFHELYTRAMKEKETSDFYLFSLDFLKKLYDNMKDNMILLFQEYRDDTIAASIKLHSDGIMYGFLGGRNPDFPNINNYHLILYESMLLGKEKGINIYDLGGGPEGSGLLKFKKKFSKNTFSLYGLKKIFKERNYKKLCNDRGIEPNEIQFESASFFPEYRNRCA